MIQTKAELVYNKRLKGRYMRCMLYAPWIARQAGPGQFVNIRVNNGDGPLLRRPFSIHKVTPLRGQARSPSHQVTKSPGLAA
jgi:dihydroorotate dehydrogenase electron transfer subunit